MENSQEAICISNWYHLTTKKPPYKWILQTTQWILQNLLKSREKICAYDFHESPFDMFFSAVLNNAPRRNDLVFEMYIIIGISNIRAKFFSFLFFTKHDNNWGILFLPSKLYSHKKHQKCWWIDKILLACVQWSE